MPTTPLRFITTLFGNRHVGMLLPFLYSVEKSNPDAAISVYWEDINQETIGQMMEAFPQVDWVETHFNFSTDVTRRISSKMLVLHQAAQEKSITDQGWLVFMDVDMLVRKDILSFLEPIASDAVLTYRRGSQFPINSGVVAFRASKETALFFQDWLDKTQEILATPDLYAQANDRQRPYGGADQMALHILLNYGPDQLQYQYSLSESRQITLKMQPCEDLNETQSVPITERTRIIHYKGGWRSILFEGGPFTKNRTKRESWDMFVYYHRVYREALEQFNQRANMHLDADHFGLTTPWFFEIETGKERFGFYFLYWLFWQIRNFIPRLERYLADRLR